MPEDLRPISSTSHGTSLKQPQRYAEPSAAVKTFKKSLEKAPDLDTSEASTSKKRKFSSEFGEERSEASASKKRKFSPGFEGERVVISDSKPALPSSALVRRALDLAAHLTTTPSNESSNNESSNNMAPEQVKKFLNAYQPKESAPLQGRVQQR